MQNAKPNLNAVFKKLFEDHYKDNLSIREFARLINEDTVDVTRWIKGSNKITARGVIAICRLHPEIKPHELNPFIFPDDLSIQFNKKD